MKKLFVGLTLLLAGVLGTMSFSARSLSAAPVNLADYPHLTLTRPQKTNLSASACANAAQNALKKSGFGNIGSNAPGYGLVGYQGSYSAAIAWEADLHAYFLVVAGPDKSQAANYEQTLRNNAKSSFEK